tara:strand:- start:1247 stop:3448 length:2202 start_codon:yes stop_codon:yes gene_type:complete
MENSRIMNPYQEWLGIQSANPNPWEILGLEEDYHDAEVVKTAAMHQVDILRGFRLTEHCKLAEEIISEVVLARNILLSPSAVNVYLDREIDLLWQNIQVDESEKVIKESEDPLLAILKIAPDQMPVKLTGALSMAGAGMGLKSLPNQLQSRKWTGYQDGRVNVRKILRIAFKASLLTMVVGGIVIGGMWIYQPTESVPIDEAPVVVDDQVNQDKISRLTALNFGDAEGEIKPDELGIRYTHRAGLNVTQNGRRIYSLVVSNRPVLIEVFETYLEEQNLKLACFESKDELTRLFDSTLKQDDELWLNGPLAEEAAKFVVGPLLGMQMSPKDLEFYWLDDTENVFVEDDFVEPYRPVLTWRNSTRSRVVVGGVGKRDVNFIRVPIDEMIKSAIVESVVEITENKVSMEKEHKEESIVKDAAPSSDSAEVALNRYRVVATLANGEGVTALDYFGGALLAGGANGSVSFWKNPFDDLPNRKRKLITSNSEIISAEIADDFSIHVSDARGFYKIWDNRENKTDLVGRIQNGSRFVVADVQQQHVQGLPTRYEKGRPSGSYSNQSYAVLMERGSFIRGNNDIVTREHYLELIDLGAQNSTIAKRLMSPSPDQQHQSHISAITASELEDQIVSIDEEGRIQHWSFIPNRRDWVLRGQGKVNLVEGDMVRSATFADESTVIIAAKRGGVYRLNLPIEIPAVSENIAEIGQQLSVVIRLDKKRLAIGSMAGPESKIVILERN